MGRDADRRDPHYDSELHYDHERLRALFPDLPVHGHRAHSPGRLCRGAQPEHWQKLFKKLCGGLPRGGHCGAGLCDFYGLCGQPAPGGPKRQRHHHGLDLCRGAGLQHAGPGRHHQDVGPGGAGDDIWITKVSRK